MKTIEEKAKAYDEALEQAQKELATCGSMDCDAARQIFRLFPQLRESEDEKIMREFNDWLCEEIECRTDDLRDEKDRRTLNMLCYVLTKVKDWLEKQKEQKPAEKQDYSGLTDFERAIHRGFLCAGVENVPVTIIKETAQDCLAHLPAEWSDEDEKKIHFLSRLINFQVNDGEYCFGWNHRMVSKQEAIEMLLSLRPQPKPSWSEEDKQWLSEIYFAIDHSMYSEDERQAMKKYIDSLRPPFKPSEEQMNTIGLAIQVLNSSGHNSLCCKLNALRDDLLKQK